MEPKSAIILATRRYIAPTVVVLLLLASGMAYVWSQYQQLLEEKEQLAEERKSLYQEALLAEKNRVNSEIELVNKKAELERREFLLHQLEAQNKERLVALQQRANEYESAFGKLQEAQSDVSQAQQVKSAEEKIHRLMSDFSAMGVNLNTALRCDDNDSQQKFNTAKAKFMEAYALAEAYGLKERY